MAPAPTGPAAVRLWDAIQVLSEHEGFFEFARPARTSRCCISPTKRAMPLA